MSIEAMQLEVVRGRYWGFEKERKRRHRNYVFFHDLNFLDYVQTNWRTAGE
jgi:hypothetical protein